MLGDVADLGVGGAQEFAAGGELVKEIADFDGRADIAGAGPDGFVLGRSRSRASGGDGIGGAADDRDSLGDRGDAGQGLAAKAHGADAMEVVVGADLAGGVRLEGQGQVVGVHAAAVVGDAMHLRPPSSTATVMRSAPASMLFSSSSLTTLAGRSMTSPAAIILTMLSSRTAILAIKVLLAVRDSFAVTAAGSCRSFRPVSAGP